MSFPFITLAAVNASEGAANAGAVPVLNSNGLLDMSFMQGANVTSPDNTALAGLLPFLNADGVLDPSFYSGVTTGGTTGQAGDTPLLNSQGLLDPSFLKGVFSDGGSSPQLIVGGWMFQWGTGTIPQSGTHTSSATVAFPVAMATCNFVVVVPTSGSLTSQGYNAIPLVSAKSGSSFTVEIDINAPGSIPPITNPTQIMWLAIGTPT